MAKPSWQRSRPKSRSGSRQRDRDESSSSDSDDAKPTNRVRCIKDQSRGFKIPCLNIGSRIKSCADRMACGLPCFTPLNAACFYLYAVVLLGLIAFLYGYGYPLLNFLRHISTFFLHAILPASWLKSTSTIVDEALAKYSADRIGQADYALESSGGTILCSSETYYTKRGILYSIFSLPLWYHTSSPRAVIQPDVQPGNCWAMDGQTGHVMIQLTMPTIVEAVTLEHIPLRVSPSGKLDTAPKQFEIVGKEKDMGSPEVWLGEFVYRIDIGQPIQSFLIKDPYCTKQSLDHTNCGLNQQVFNVIQLNINSNHGNPDFTCIYRLRVHGMPPYLRRRSQEQP